MQNPADLAIIGPMPPPFGGISVHIKRLCPLLTSAGISWHLYNPTSLSGGPDVTSVAGRRQRWLARHALFSRENVTHFHGIDNTLARAAALPLCARGKKVILSYHNASTIPAMERLPRFERRLLEAQLKTASAVHVVNDAMADSLRAWGIAEERLFSFPAFLPPTDAETHRAGLPQDVLAFMARCSPCLVAIGAAESTARHSDVYGLGMLVDLIEDLRSTLPEVGLVLFLHINSRESDPPIRALLERIQAKGLGNHMLLVRHEGECFPAFAAADMYLRPTSTDGDALAVRESLWLGTPAVASDAASRPIGTVLFRSGDRESFAQVVGDTWRNVEQVRSEIGRLPHEDPSKTVIEMYQRVMSASA